MISETTKWIFIQMISKKRLLVLTILFTIIFSTIGLLTPLITGFAIDSLTDTLEKGVSENELSSGIEQIFFFSGLILIFILISYGFGVLAWYTGEVYTAKITQNLRSDIFRTFQNQSHKYFDTNSTGDLLSKATSDIMALWNFFWVIPYFGLSGIWSLLVTFLIFFYIDFQLGVVSFLFLPIILYTSKRFSVYYNPIVYTSRQQFGQLTKVLQENLEGAVVSRAFGAKNKEVMRFDTENRKYRDVMFSVRKKQAQFSPQMKFLAGTITSFVLIIGSLRVIEGTMTIGMLVASILLATMLIQPIDRITDLFIDSGIGYGASRRVMEILFSTPEIRSISDSINLSSSFTGAITFKEVSFGYRDQPVLSNINLHIPGGTSVVLLGASGSGKSSLINLIPRYYDTLHGMVMVDGIDVRNITLESLRKSIGFVDQETFLFSKTIQNNIAFGHPKATLEDVISVAKAAKAHEFISKFPSGYNTLIGERGVNLSGGQRQRISIARALLTDPKIVVLDDSLSAVDMKTEKAIREATEALLKNRTTIIVTQRLSFISTANKIILLQRGKIIEEGTHLELIQLNRYYKRLVNTQKDGLVDLSTLMESNQVLEVSEDD